MVILKFMHVVLSYIKRKAYLMKIILLVAAATALGLGYLFMRTNERIEYEKVIIMDDKVDATRKAIHQIANDAKAEGERLVQEFNTEITFAYGKDKLAIRKDLEDFVNEVERETPLSLLIYKYTKGKYFNVKNDNNDPFVITVKYMIEEKDGSKIMKSEKKVTSDWSTNCISPFARTLIQERDEAGGDGHFAKGLTIDAIESTISGDKAIGIWHFLDVPEAYAWHSDIENMKEINIELLLDLYKKYNVDLRVLEGFEFIQAIPINPAVDLSGEELFTYKSTLNTDALILYYYYNFNFIDQLSVYVDFKTELHNYDVKIASLIHESNSQKKSYVLVLSMLIIVVISTANALSANAMNVSDAIDKK